MASRAPRHQRAGGQRRARAADGRPRRRHGTPRGHRHDVLRDGARGGHRARPALPELRAHRHGRRAVEPRARRAARRPARDRPGLDRARRLRPPRRLPRSPVAHVAAAVRRVALARPAPLDRLQDELGRRPPATRGPRRARRLPARQRARGGVGRRRPRSRRSSTGRCPRSATPCVDLGMFGLYWDIGDAARHRWRDAERRRPGAGYPSFDELVDAYAARAGIDVPDLRWYRAFAAYKLGVIAEGIHFRYQPGETVGEGFDRIGALVEPSPPRASPASPPEGLTWTSPTTTAPPTHRAGCAPSSTSRSSRPSPCSTSSSRPPRTTGAPARSCASCRRAPGSRACGTSSSPGDARRGTHEPPVRAARRAHRLEPAARAGRHQLRRPRHRQHGAARRLRHRRAEAAVARTAARRAASARRSA